MKHKRLFKSTVGMLFIMLFITLTGCSGNTVRPKTNKPITNEPSTKEPSTNEPSTNEPSTNEPSTNEPSTNEPSTNEPSTNEPSTNKPGKAISSKQSSSDPGALRILDESTGKTGLIQVVQRNGKRLLLIKKVVQASKPLNHKGPTPDPMVDLLKALKPRAETAFVLGLGSGNTAQYLMNRGLNVQAAEIEGAVVKYARKHFGYKGHAYVGDGLDFLKKSWRVYDLVLFDGFIGDKTPDHLLTAEALQTAWSRVFTDGVLAVRLLASPQDPAVQKLLKTAVALKKHHPKDSSKDVDEDMDDGADEDMAFEDNVSVQLYGNGVGNERQNLYVLISSGDLSVKAPKGLCLWKIPIHNSTVDDPLAFSEEERFSQSIAEKSVRLLKMNRDNSKRMLVVGHLIRSDPGGELFMDPPHPEMGAFSFQLKGQQTKDLKKLIQKVHEFPTQGGSVLDGDLSSTTAELVALYRISGSAQRYSPVLAGIEGSVKLKKTTDFKNIYLMQIEKVHFAMTHSKWTKFKKEVLSHPLRQTALFLEKGNFKSAAEQLGVYLKKFNKAFSNMGKAIPLYNTVSHIQRVLETKGRDLKTKSRDLKTKSRDLKTKSRDLKTKSRDLENKQTAQFHKQIAITCRDLSYVQSFLPPALSDAFKKCIKRAEALEKKTREEEKSK